MWLATKRNFCLAVALLVSSPALGSIQGDYAGNYAVGREGGAAYSYIHTSYTSDKMGDAGYYQAAGGVVLYAIDTTQSIDFFFDDNGPAGLSDGDSITFSDSTIGIRDHSGSLGSPNTSDLVGHLSLTGTLNVGGNSSSSFSHGINNITDSVADEEFAHTGVVYTITSLTNEVLFSGEIFFQSGALAGPFNGIEYDDLTDTLTFAVWGNSLNKGGRRSGIDASGGDFPLGFDLFVSANMIPGPGSQNQPVPEAASFAIWSLLTCVGISMGRRKAVLR